MTHLVGRQIRASRRAAADDAGWVVCSRTFSSSQPISARLRERARHLLAFAHERLSTFRAEPPETAKASAIAGERPRRRGGTPRAIVSPSSPRGTNDLWVTPT